MSTIRIDSEFDVEAICDNCRCELHVWPYSANKLGVTPCPSCVEDAEKEARDELEPQLEALRDEIEELNVEKRRLEDEVEGLEAALQSLGEY